MKNSFNLLFTGALSVLLFTSCGRPDTSANDTGNSTYGQDHPAIGTDGDGNSGSNTNGGSNGTGNGSQNGTGTSGNGTAESSGGTGTGSTGTNNSGGNGTSR